MNTKKMALLVIASMAATVFAASGAAQTNRIARLATIRVFNPFTYSSSTISVPVESDRQPEQDQLQLFLAGNRLFDVPVSEETVLLRRPAIKAQVRHRLRSPFQVPRL